MARGPGKGISNNPKGKPIGAKNKISTEVKERLALFVSSEFDDFIKTFRGLKPELKAKLYLDAVKLILPKEKEINEEEENIRRHKELLDRIWPVPRQD